MISYLRRYYFWAERDTLVLSKNRPHCCSARRDLDNLYWLASPLVRVPKSWPRGRESESRAWTELGVLVENGHPKVKWLVHDSFYLAQTHTQQCHFLEHIAEQPPCCVTNRHDTAETQKQFTHNFVPKGALYVQQQGKT